jgi:hypothetical protein
MATFEYKTLLLPYKPSCFQSDNFEIQEALNVAAGEQWKLCQLVLPSTVWGRSNGLIAVLERPRQ